MLFLHFLISSFLAYLSSNFGKNRGPQRADVYPIRTTDITWNFEKFLVDRQGRPRFRFHPTNWIGGKAIEDYLNKLLEEKEESRKNIDRDL
jgi:glutathione peroxidase-family protein